MIKLSLKRRMKLLQRLSQKLSVKMRIDLCSGDAFMTKHFLHGTEIGVSLVVINQCPEAAV